MSSERKRKHEVEKTGRIMVAKNGEKIKKEHEKINEQAGLVAW